MRIELTGDGNHELSAESRSDAFVRAIDLAQEGIESEITRNGAVIARIVPMPENVQVTCKGGIELPKIGDIRAL